MLFPIRSNESVLIANVISAALKVVQEEDIDVALVSTRLLRKYWHWD